jgi:hypothetical protein
MLSSLAPRSFIFHANQWLVLKAVRQAPAGPAYPQRPRCPADIFCNLARWREDLFPALFLCSMDMREIRRLPAPPDHARLHLWRGQRHEFVKRRLRIH